MPTQKKIDTVEALKQKFATCTIAVATDYTGLDVNNMTELRQRMGAREVQYLVVKNTLAYLAAEAAERPQIKEIVQGPTGLAFGYGDPVEVAKALDEYVRTTRSSLVIRGAVLEQRRLSSSEVTRLSSLPPREQLVAQLLGNAQMPLALLMGQLRAPMSRLLSTLNGPLVALDILLQQRVQQLKSQEAT